jgi:hydroxymethylpyrimidine pyrophosphatase-like HAD family hydrolase
LEKTKKCCIFAKEIKLNMEGTEASVFRYRTNVGIEVEEILRTTYFDGMKFWRMYDLTLDDAERHAVEIIENCQWYRNKIAYELRKLADKIESGEQNLNGCIVDYDSYIVYNPTNVINVDWDKLNEEKREKSNGNIKE